MLCVKVCYVHVFLYINNITIKCLLFIQLKWSKHNIHFDTKYWRMATILKHLSCLISDIWLSNLIFSEKEANITIYGYCECMCLNDVNAGTNKNVALTQIQFHKTCFNIVHSIVLQILNHAIVKQEGWKSMKSNSLKAWFF